jgi:hypothetical protein
MVDRFAGAGLPAMKSFRSSGGVSCDQFMPPQRPAPREQILAALQHLEPSRDIRASFQ